MILAKKKATNQRFAVKILKKCHIISCCSVNYTIIDKEALVLVSGHPFITTLYSCFLTKVIFNFLKLLHIYRASLILKFTISLKMFRCICKIAKIDYELHHVCLAVHLSVCLSVWNDSAPTGHIFIKLECIKLNENLSKICQNNWSFTKVL